MKMRGKWIGNIGVLMALLLLLVPLLASPVQAATTANVAVNATPSYVAITNAPSGYGFGTVAASTNYSTTTGYFTITNGSTVNVDITVGCNATWAGGITWTHSDVGTPGADTAALYSSPNTAAWNIIVKNASRNNIYANEGGASLDWELRLMAPTSFGDATLKTNTVVLTATAT